MRALAAGIVLSLITTSALAASPLVEAAIKAFKSVSADPDRLKTFCEMMAIDEKIGDKKDPVLQSQVDKLIDLLGADFKAAWELAEGINEESTDGKVLNAALDELSEK